MKKGLVLVLAIIVTLILCGTVFLVTNKSLFRDDSKSLGSNVSVSGENDLEEEIKISFKEYPSVYTDIKDDLVVSKLADTFLGSDADKLKINVSGDDAYTNLIDGNVQIAYAPLISEELQKYADTKQVGVYLIHFTNRPIVFIVNSENTNIGLAMEEIRGIYSGKIKTWSEVGGVSKSIIAYQRGSGSTLQSNLADFMGEEKIVSPSKDLIKEDIYELVKAISEGENAKMALGFAYLDEVEPYLENNNIKILVVDGLEPTDANVSNNTYPIREEGYLAIKESDRNDPNVQKWVDAAFSKKGKEAVKKAGLVVVE